MKERCMVCATHERPLYSIEKDSDILILCYRCGKSSFGELWDFKAGIIKIQD